MDKPAHNTLDIAVRRHGDVVVVAVAGEIDMRTAPQLGDALREAVGQTPATLIVDLSEVGFLASAGLGVLAAAHSDSPAGPSFRVVAHGTALRPLQVTGLDTLFDVYPDLDQALTPDP